MRLQALKWEMKPLQVVRVHAAFFEDPRRFPRGSVEFDNALIMRRIPSDWHEVSGTAEAIRVLA